MAEGRVLKARPSSGSDLQPWQLSLTEKLSALHQEAFEKRLALTNTVMEFPKPIGEEAVNEVSYAVRMAFNIPEAAAHEQAKDILKAGDADFTGSRDTCILMWSFEEQSLWRGLSDNKKLVRLARNMVTTGYLRDEPIRSRTFDLRAESGVVAAQLLFGDGQARGLAARLAWQFLLNLMRSTNDLLMGDPEMMRIMQSLLFIPTVFEKQGGACSQEDLMVAQAVRQNMKAQMQLPLNTIEWAGMILRTCGLQVGVSPASTQAILSCLERCKSKYDSHVEVEAYDVQPVAKRARKGRTRGAKAVAVAAMEVEGSSTSKQQPEENVDRLRIGNRRLAAITNLLGRCTKKSYKSMTIHLVWAGDYTYSALSDHALNLNFIFPETLPPTEIIPDEATRIARDVAAGSNKDLVPPGATVRPMKYEEILTDAQHEQVIEKVLTCYEDEVLHLTDRNEWLKRMPKDESWLAARQIIQHWDQTMAYVCMQDLPKEEFDELKKAVLFGDAMDAQILSIIKRYPKHFHIGMIPDMKTSFKSSAVDEALQVQMDAEAESWQARLKLFKSNLTLDQHLIKRTEMGSVALNDILEWHDAEQVRKQGLIGKNLVQQFMATTFPKAVASSWADVPGAIALAMQTVHHLDSEPTAPPRILAIVDFNVPNARDVLKLKEILGAVTSLFKNNNPNKCALLAHMAAYSKEDADNDPVDDEVMIKNVLKKAGFGAQQTIRMLLTQPPNVDRTLTVGDWHADSRLCYLAPNDIAARGLVKGIHGNDWRMHSELARKTSIVARPKVPEAHEYIHVTTEDLDSTMTPDSRVNKEDKAAQRGAEAAAAYLQQLFAKAAVTSADSAVASKWIEPGDETFIADFTPHVGDRAMGTLLVRDDANVGTLRHVVLDSGYKRMGQGASFTLSRVANEVAEQWMNRTRILYDRVQDGMGNYTKTPKQPISTVPEPDEALLKQTPGVFEAWKGLSNLELKVCTVAGAKIVVSPEKVAEFQHAPLSISEEVRHLEQNHSKNFEDLLSYMASGTSAAAPADDPRDTPTPKEEAKNDFPTFESLAALQGHAPGLIEIQAMGDKHVTLLKDDTRREVWLIAKNDDHIVAKNTLIGGYGGGQLYPRKQDRTDVVPWRLPKGDKTWIQMGGTDEGDGKQPKPKSGSLYMLAKPLEKKAAQNGHGLSLTSYGKLKAEGKAGGHSFAFEFADGDPKHVAQDYVLSNSPNTKPSSGNLFANFATREGWGGILIDMWRLAYDGVRHALHARKPFIITSEVLHLKKGVPVKVMWLKKADSKPKEDGKPSPNPAPIAAA